MACAARPSLRLLALAFVLAACGPPAVMTPAERSASPGGHAEDPRAGEASSDEPAERPSDEPETAQTIRLVRLPLERGVPAVVSEPLVAGDGQPVLVATHGAGGTGEVHCAIWRTIVGPRGFILCPQGVPMSRHGDAYFYDGHPALGKEITLAVDALAKRYGKRADLHRPVFAGYSQGACMGSMILPRHGAGFAGAVLIEGGVGQYQEWNVATARQFHQQGATRVLMACGRPVCRERAERTAKYMERGGLETRLVYAPVGHWFGDELYDEVLASFAWVVAGDRRWTTTSGR